MVTLAFLENNFFWGVVLVQVRNLVLGIGSSSIIWHKIEILHQCNKRVKTKSQAVFGANSYVCRSYGEKTGRGTFCSSPPPSPPAILNRVKTSFLLLKQDTEDLMKRLWFCNLNNRKCSKESKNIFLFPEKQRIIIKIAINKVIKSQHKCTEIQ